MADDSTASTASDGTEPESQFVDIGDYSYEGYTAMNEAIEMDALDAAINEGSTAHAIDMLEQDPELAARTIFVAPERDNDGGQLHLGQIAGTDITIDAPEGGVIDTLTDAWRMAEAVQEGVDRANESRELLGMELLDETDAEIAAETVAEGQYELSDGNPGSFADSHYDDISTAFMSPHSNGMEVGAHELSHAATNAAFDGDPAAGGVDSFQDEAIAQTTAQLSASRYLTAQEVADTARQDAMDSAAHTIDDLQHMGDVDAQLKLAHQLETNPDRVLREAGTTITGQEKWVRENLVMSGDPSRTLTDYDHMTMASAFAEESLSGRPIGVPEFTRDGIVVLLNAERGAIAEQGMNNGLTQRMEEVRQASPEAFKQAEEYAEKNYGEKPVVRQPPRMGM